MPGVFLQAPGPVYLDPNDQAVHATTTVASSGSTILSGYGHKEIVLVINVTSAPTGTTPTLQYTIQEVDPSNLTTVFGPTATSTVINAIGIQTVTLPATVGSAVKVSWVVTGAGASFTNVNATLLQRGGGKVDGLGVAGTAAGGVVTVQGVSGGTALPVTFSNIDGALSTTLGSLNDRISIPLAGYSGAGLQLSAGTLIGTIVPEVSLDGGTTWNPTFFDEPATGNKTSSIVFASANTAQARTLVGAGGASHLSVKVSAYTSGSAVFQLRASGVNDPSGLSTGSSGSANPPLVGLVGGSTGSLILPLTMKGASTAPIATDPAAVVTLSPNSPPGTNYLSSESAYLAVVNPYGKLGVSADPSVIFYDSFDGATLDTAIRWGTTVAGGGSQSLTGGALNLNTLTTPNNGIAVVSNPTLSSLGLAPQAFFAQIQFEASPPSNCDRFWGVGTPPTTWQAVQQSPTQGPIRNGIGFELDTSAGLSAVIWSSGVKVFSQALTKPTDAAYHRYIFTYRSDNVVFYLDDLDTPVAVATAKVPDVQLLPIRLASINAQVSGPGSSPVFKILNVSWSDYGHNSAAISDGTYAFRKAAVKPASTPADSTDPALVVAISPNNNVPVSVTLAGSNPGFANGDVALSSVTTAVVRRNVYTEQTANFQGSIVSTNAADAAAGTGSRTVRITYLDATGAGPFTETVTLNGTTAVNLVNTNHCYIEKMEVLTVGSTGGGVGAINLKTGLAGAGTTVGNIEIGDTQTFWCHHYIPTGKSCYVTSIQHGNSATAAGGKSFAVLKYTSIGTNQAEKVLTDFVSVGGASNQVVRVYGAPPKVTGPARLLMYVRSGAAASNTYRASFDYYDL